MPVFAFSAGFDRYEVVGAQMFFASDEALAGQAAAGSPLAAARTCSA